MALKMPSRSASKAWKDIWSARQGVGAIRKIEPAAQIIMQINREYVEAIRTEKHDPWFRRYAV